MRGIPGMSLDWPTCRCRRTESIVSLERGVCSCAELQVFFVTEAERKRVRRRARFQQHGNARCHQVILSPARQAPREIHASLTETLGENTPSHATVNKTGWSSLNMVFFFSTCDKPRPGRPKNLVIYNKLIQFWIDKGVWCVEGNLSACWLPVPNELILKFGLYYSTN